jgi:hypothetical protein
VAFATVLALAGCGGGSAAPAPADNGSEPAAEQSDFDAVAFYWGQWRGSVEMTGDSPYGTQIGMEQMLDVFLNQDGTCEIKPLPAHADLMTATGTWEAADETCVTLHLESGDIVLTTQNKDTLTGNAADFGIADFDEIVLVLY